MEPKPEYRMVAGNCRSGSLTVQRLFGRSYKSQAAVWKPVGYWNSSSAASPIPYFPRMGKSGLNAFLAGLGGGLNSDPSKSSGVDSRGIRTHLRAILDDRLPYRHCQFVV